MASDEAIRQIAESMPDQQQPAAKASFGLADTWPARIARSMLSAAKLPGDVYQGNVSMTGDDGRTNPEVIDRAADLGGVMLMGGMGGVPENALGGFEESAPSAVPSSPYMKPADWAFIAKNGGLSARHDNSTTY